MSKRLCVILFTCCLFTPATVLANPLANSASAPQSEPKQASAPAELLSFLRALDGAANKKDGAAVLAAHAPGFSHGDGLTREQMREALQALWQRYPDLRHTTELVKWERRGDRLVAQTRTRMVGKAAESNDNFALNATLLSEQEYQVRDRQLQITKQEILAEQNTLTTGEKPPQVRLRMPERIGVGRQYVLDAVVTEPLGNSMLLGTQLEEAVNPREYLRDTTANLTPLRAGGIFKIGQAPFRVGSRWVSVVLVRETGITITSQRLRVERDFVGNQYTPLLEPDSTPGRVRPPRDNRSS
ncbi:MAG: ester cyclase [Oscillatoriales cyanobacterium SM2_2_1]|nr:ester cyclase [Oscillatoriales cyanobacterium SM2_2_1]